MAKPYSIDLRARVVAAIEEGATREEAAERHNVSLSSAGRFLRLKREQGSVSPAKFGGYKPYALATHEARHWHVLEQDREMLTNIPPDAHKREMLYQHDVGVARMRRMLSQQVKDQLAAEDMASVRTAV